MRFTKSFPVICLIIISILTYSVLTQDQPSNPDDNATPNDNTTPNNNTTPSDNTTPNDNTTLSNNAIHSLCPPPLIIRNPDEYVRTESQNCIGDCCLACPFSYNFYEKNKIENTYKAFSILGIISFSLMLILAFIFIKLPSQKQNPLSKLILLPLALSVMIFEGSEFFTVNQRQSQCNNPITPADKNNDYCAAQAFFTLGGGFAIACYSALLMTHLHLISVWRIEFISNKIAYFHFLIVGASLAAFMIPYVNNLIQSTGICFVSLEAAPAFFYSLSFIYIAFVAHLSTFIHMAHISIKSNNRHSTMSRMSMIEAQRKLIRLKTIINIQWRSLLGALLMLIIYILNWYYYIFELRSLTDPVLTSTWINGWVGCLQSSSGDLDLCAKQFSDNVPSYNYIFTLLFFNRTAGILIFIIFAVKRSVLLDVLEFIGVRRNGSNANVSMSYYEESKYPSIRTRDSLAKRKLSSDRFGNNVADIRNMRYSMNKDIATISDIDSDSFDIESNLGIESGPGIGRNSFGVENGLDALSNKSSEKSRNYLDAPTENLDAFSENNVDAVSENNLDAFSENNVDAFSENNVYAYSENNVDAISESNVDAISESNVDAISESNVDAISESNVDAISESNVGAYSGNNVDAYSENNVDAVSENNVDAISENNVDAVSESNVDAFSENNVDAISESNVDAVSESNVDAYSESNVDVFSENTVDVFSETNDDAFSETNDDVFSENNGDAFSETNGDGLSEAFSIVSRDTSIIISKDPPMSRRIIRFSQDLPSRRDFFPLPPMSDDDM